MEEETKKSICDEVIENVENKLEELNKEPLTRENVDYTFKLVDILKNLKNISYWKEKIMRYRTYRGGDGNESYGYDSYGRRGVAGTGRRYSEGSYGRRGVDSKYRGDDYLADMQDSYHNYSDSYGKDTQSLEYMLQSAYDFMKHISNEASSQEDMELVKEYAEKISRL